MPITEKKQSAPLWRCQDCNHTFSGRDISPDTANIDDAHDVFSKHRGPAGNICPRCGGALTLIGRS
jgi:ribosomal protein L37AE/L43A